MDESEARGVWSAILAELGIGRGDVVYLGVDMGRLPLPAYAAPLTREGMRQREAVWRAFLLAVLQEALGPEGTILAPAFSYDYARRGTPFHLESSPSEVGPFTEFLRQQPEAARSLHPIFSVCGVGRQARAILDNVGKSAFGGRSPFMRLKDHDAKFLCLGASFAASNTYIHHVEQLYGVNHMFTKAYHAPVFRGGVEMPGPWLAFVRYLGAGIEIDFHPFEARLRSEGALRESGRWNRPMQCVSVHEVDRVGGRMLEENPWAFVRYPVEVRMEHDPEAPAPDQAETWSGTWRAAKRSRFARTGEPDRRNEPEG
ncbi:MAG: AAC(3) family N-acetyltransferase [Magnetococcales bacterium]|nr:AAC(3) family N-acetyltransferase [Magnetococcales bacterium]